MGTLELPVSLHRKSPRKRTNSCLALLFLLYYLPLKGGDNVFCCLVTISPTQLSWELSYLNCVSLGIIHYISTVQLFMLQHQCNAAKKIKNKKITGRKKVRVTEDFSPPFNLSLILHREQYQGWICWLLTLISHVTQCDL